MANDKLLVPHKIPCSTPIVKTEFLRIVETAVCH